MHKPCHIGSKRSRWLAGAGLALALFAGCGDNGNNVNVSSGPATCAENNGGCPALVVCTDTEGGVSCGDCLAGYSPDATSTDGCVDVDECLTDNGGCDPLTACTNTPGARTCGACPDGYTGDGETGCVDVDECLTDNGGCDPLTACTNTVGGASCGPCPSGYDGDGEAGCVDVDECDLGTAGCDPLVVCTNTPGAFTCGGCPEGYTGGGDSGCIDVDECAANNGGCDPLTVCTNTPGARACGPCPSGYDGDGEAGCADRDECDLGTAGCDPLVVCTNTPGAFTCGDCPEGYTGGGDSGCIDVDECDANNGGCDPLTVCTNTPGARTCGACPDGYTGDGEAGCADINECDADNGGCDPLTVCTNTPGARTCSACPDGYDGDGEAGCVDVDECADNNGGCDPVVVCTNTPGAFTCGACPSGYTGDGVTGCVDINECADNNGGCEGSCLNEAGRRVCLCEVGYAVSADGTRCENIDECATNNGGCSDTCVDTEGGYTCGCGAGYELGPDGRTCRDINECFVDNGGCDPLVACANQDGAPPTCGACPAGFSGDGDTGCVEDGTIPGGTRVVTGASDAEFDALRDAWNPQLPPDRNALTPVPGVLVTTDDQRNRVVVTPEALRFPVGVDGVDAWEPGRVIASLPSEPGSPGKNGFGFLRKVSRVEQIGDETVVWTTTAALEEAFHGELQMEFDAANARVVEWDEFDHAWAAENLYVDVGLISGELPLGLRDNTNLPGIDTLGSPESPEGDPIFGKAFRKIGGAVASGFRAVVGGVKTVLNAAVDLYAAIVPSHFRGSLQLDKRLDLSAKQPIFSITYSNKGSNVEFALAGRGNVTAGLEFNPRTSVGVIVPNPIGVNKPPFEIWMDVDAYMNTQMALEVELEAKLTSSGGVSGDELDVLLGGDTEFTERTLKAYKEELLGNPDHKPAGGWKKTIWLSKPSSQWILAGGVPVVFTQTFQLDLECGFEMKGSIKANTSNRTARTLKFRASYVHHGDSSLTDPSAERVTSNDVTVTGGGEIGIACGLIPRINAYAYDMVGLNLGLRGSLQAKASYTSTCENAVATTRPDGEVALELGGSIGIQFGGRLQAPGSSYAGTDGTSAGLDIGPKELFSRYFSLYNRTWEFPGAGFGYCQSSCANGAQDNDELGVDCGGPCPTGCGEGATCNVNRDCANGLYCSGGTCSDDHCLDGVFSGDETATDCGGSRCAPCALGKACVSPTDCESQACYVETRGVPSDLGVCVSDPCLDNQVSPGECGVDCGTVCGNLCPLGATCNDPAQCASGIASAYSCVTEQCTNLTVDGGETDLDCGGDTPCDRCAPGKACDDASDCMASAPLCDPVRGVCYQVACLNEVKDNGEGDVDCGGSCEARCQVGQTCNTHRDCALGLGCNPDIGVCTQPTCNDGWAGPFEGDVDCGGICSAKCALGQMCRRSNDCDSGICFEGTCVDSDCADRRQTGSETDVDCGGVCNPCLAGRVCLVNSDCFSGVCDERGVCAEATCDDGLQNGSESDVDCGGTCDGCDDGEACRSEGDCASASCDADALTCVAATCDDGRRNGDEGDVDCGGSACAQRCASGDLCNTAGDCASQACINGVCSEAHCGDGVLSGTETDIDCGGACDAGCADGQRCAVSSDCESGKCEGEQCAPATCDDALENQDETDVDCGGVCPACNDGQRCGVGADCASRVCEGGTCAVASCNDNVQNGDEEEVDCGGSCGPCTVRALGSATSGFASKGSFPHGFTQLGDKLVFVAQEHNAYAKGLEPWVTDGTSDGTFELVDTNVGDRHGDVLAFFLDGISFYCFDRALLGDDILIFAARERSRNDFRQSPNTLWRTDGTREGTFRLATAGRISNLYSAGDRVYFAYSDTDTTNDSLIWVTDGTAPGTVAVEDAPPIAPMGPFIGRDCSGSESALVRVGNQLVFSATNPSNRQWKQVQTLDTTGASAPQVLSSGRELLFGPVRGLGGAIFLEKYRDDQFVERQRIRLTDGTLNGSIDFDNDSAAVTPLGGSFIAEDDRAFVSGTANNTASLYVLDNNLNATLLAAGTTLIDIQPRRAPVRIGDTSFFAAQTTGVDGAYLWKSDGTPEGTEQLVLLNEAVSNVSSYSRMVVANGKLYFGAWPDNTYASTQPELWVSDGTLAGTRGLGITFDAVDTNALGAIEDTAVFQSKTDWHRGELFSTDGTEAGTGLLKNINTQIVEEDTSYRIRLIPQMAASGGVAHFLLEEPDGVGQIWETDGTRAGTALKAALTELSYDRESSRKPVNLGSMGGMALVQTIGAPAGQVPSQFWAVGDGAPVELVSITDDATNHTTNAIKATFSAPRGDGLVFFRQSNRIYATDGTPAGTNLMTTSGGLLYRTFDFTGFSHLSNAQTLFAGDDPPGLTIWSSDGDLVTEVLTDSISLVNNNSGTHRIGPALNGSALFGAGIRGRTVAGGVWITDGTAAGTMVLDAELNSADKFAVLGDTFFFRASTSVEGMELYASDGTILGTHMLAAINPGSADSIVGDVVADPNGNLVFFEGRDPLGSSNIYATNGEPGATIKLTDFGYPSPTVPNGFENPAYLSPLVAGGNHAFFPAYTDAEGVELWVTDGTPAGTHIVVDLAPGPASSYPDHLFWVPEHQTLYFTASNGARDRTYWAYTPE